MRPLLRLINVVFAPVALLIVTGHALSASSFPPNVFQGGAYVDSPTFNTSCSATSVPPAAGVSVGCGLNLPDGCQFTNSCSTYGNGVAFGGAGIDGVHLFGDYLFQGLSQPLFTGPSAIGFGADGYSEVFLWYGVPLPNPNSFFGTFSISTNGIFENLVGADQRLYAEADISTSTGFTYVCQIISPAQPSCEGNFVGQPYKIVLQGSVKMTLSDTSLGTGSGRFSADFSHTISLTGFSMNDGNGNPVDLSNIQTDGGILTSNGFISTSTPEPSTTSYMLITLLVAAFRFHGWLLASRSAKPQPLFSPFSQR